MAAQMITTCFSTGSGAYCGCLRISVVFSPRVSWSRVAEFETGLYRHLESGYPELLPAIATEKTLSDELTAQLEKAVKEFKDQGGYGETDDSAAPAAAEAEADSAAPEADAAAAEAASAAPEADVAEADAAETADSAPEADAAEADAPKAEG